MAYKIIPYRQGSRGARELANALGGRVLRLEASTYVPRPQDTIINWGNADPPFLPALNEEGIREASNKLNFFNLLRDEDLTPRYWTRQEDIPNEVYPIVCRTILSGHSGAGIVIANSKDELVPAPLYVEYKKKVDEYRIHVGRLNGQSIIISYQKKVRRTDVENPNWQVRNHQNGFNYARLGVNPPQCVMDYAVRALLCTSLDFGAVDVIYNNHEQRPYALEVNTAPGLEGRTILDYAEYFRNFNRN